MEKYAKLQEYLKTVLNKDLYDTDIKVEKFVHALVAEASEDYQEIKGVHTEVGVTVIIYLSHYGFDEFA